MGSKTLSPLQISPMRPSLSRRRVTSLLEQADIHIGGDRPWDIQVHDERFFRRVLVETSLGLGESYMEGWWDCDRLDEMVCRILRAGLLRQVRSWRDVLAYLQARLLNLQDRRRAFHVGEQHYDIGNDLYQAMLDRRLIYSCGYWKEADTLDAAQEAKLELICRKLDLQPGMRVLDIGCGWAGAARYMAERYGVEVHGVTVSRQQARYARDLCRDLPVTIELKDYREIRGHFDAGFSIGMFEHVGYKNYATYMEVVRRCLPPDGLFVLHTIGGNFTETHGNPWVTRYIFPNSMLPSIRQLGAAFEGRLIVEDWQNFGPDYDRTLMAWYVNFERAWPELRPRYGDRFYRMWRFYLLSFAGAFRARYLQLWQIVLSPQGRPRRYDAPR
ncbi:cyclopropane-fatty-acyl-phospholipid synthase [Methylomarinovum tepidoasis]|uniref:Cyclopropane-fatty-acyl-phospholipid synthase n=1 Tax=Methylomarinovum tepidoasis TaxID=2840183 RepID=A0AAU9CJU0_9GAMM|nr:cyclopropane fatty acyl phospholipid synthase [Methylomarinovum sp. IN45]BCX89691.1 cyclopropane-fatty-acyl-phospholipid synthase [Methylomarinovum sp. IN45]